MTGAIPAYVDGRRMPVGKLEAHRRGLLHEAVSVFVLCKSELLIQRRALGKYHTGGLWANTCCTHPHWGETPAACAQRRLREELGVDGLSLQHRDKVTYRADVGQGMVEHECVDIFTARVPQRIRVNPDPDEVMATDWVDLGDLAGRVRKAPATYTPWLRIYLEEHADQIFA